MSQKTKNILLQVLPVITIATFFVVAIIYAAWTEPSLTPPAGNVAAPLNTSINAQAKEGALVLGTGLNPASTTLIIQNGYVGIGTSTPAEKLEVVGNVLISTTTEGYDNGLLIPFSDMSVGGGIDGMFGVRNSDMANGKITFGNKNSLNVNTWTMAIDTVNKRVGIGMGNPACQLQLFNDSACKPGGGTWSNSSDVRLKTNIHPIAGALNKIAQLQGVSFDWINPEEHGNPIGVQGGLIAQDVEKIFPEWVNEINSSGKDSELVNGGKTKSLSLPFEYDAYVVEAIKELKAENDALKQKNESLEKRIENLEKLVSPNDGKR